MEMIAAYLLPVLLCILMARMLYAPAAWILRLCAHTACGLICLGLLNTASGFTGLYLPVNAVTVLLSGAFGIPGTALVVLLEMM